MKSKMEIRKHWNRVASLGCIISNQPNPTIHHCKGGSMVGLVHKGMGQKTSDWLVIPLAWEYHTGQLGIDSGQPSLTTKDWEARFGPQALHLDEVSRRLGENVWKKAGIDREVQGLGNGRDIDAPYIGWMLDNS